MEHPIANLVKSNKNRITTPQVSPEDRDALSAGNRAFAIDFYRAIRSRSGNLFYSPLSLSMALAMTYAGARGETEAQMSHTLHFDLPQDRLHPAFNALDQELAGRAKPQSTEDKATYFKLHVANSIWGQNGYTFLPSFLDQLAQNYGAGLRLLDFSASPEPARQTINDWVEQQTENKIQDLIPQGAIETDTRLVLANAIYFNASWLHPFADKLTKDEAFHLQNGDQVNAPMMSFSEAESLGYIKGTGYQAVAVPYVGDQVEMIILLPDAGKFSDFESSLDEGQLEEILNGLNPQPVQLKMPKFNFESQFDLAGTLANMGMQDAFGTEKTDFSGMDGTRNLYISDVVHKALIKVDESGTEAAAATAVMMKLTAAFGDQPIQLMIDRPFIFLIRDIPTNTILFAGRVVNPAQ